MAIENIYKIFIKVRRVKKVGNEDYLNIEVKILIKEAFQNFIIKNIKDKV